MQCFRFVLAGAAHRWPRSPGQRGERLIVLLQHLDNGLRLELRSINHHAKNKIAGRLIKISALGFWVKTVWRMYIMSFHRDFPAAI